MSVRVSAPFILPARLRGRPPYHPAANATFGNPDFGAAGVRVLILRLSPWRDVAASAPHLFLAQAVRVAEPGAFVDFAFLPPTDERRALRAAGLPMAVGVQSRRGLSAFDLVLVSQSFTLEIINLPVLLQDAGLALWADARAEEAPPIILGGSNALASQALVRPDGVGVADALFFGEGEDAVAAFVRAWLDAAGQPKRARLLQATAGLDGFWVTGAWPTQPVRQAVARGKSMPLTLHPLLDSESADTARLSAAFGCPAFCAFCFEGFERKPYRERSADDLLMQARQLKAVSGARCVELDAYTLNSHADAARLLVELSRLFERVSFKSQRVDILAAQPALVPLEMAAGKRSFTLGVEGISDRVRATLNKAVDTETLERVLGQLLELAVREIKLFYLVTGHETAADIAAFGVFADQLAARMTGPRRSTRVVFSFGYLVRMPNTPLRYDRLFLERAPLEKIVHDLERICARSSFEFRLAASWSEYALTQILAAADYRLAPLVATLAAEGFLYDGEASVAYLQRLRDAMDAAGLWTDAFWQEKPQEHRFPFDFVQTSVSSDFLYRQYKAFRRGRDTGYCLGATCLKCGACATPDERRALVKRARAPEIPATAAADVEAVARAKQQLVPLLCRVRLDASFAGVSPVWAATRLLQLFLAAWPEEIDNLLAVDEVLFSAGENGERFPLPAGETVVALKAWSPGRLAVRLARMPEGSALTLLGPPPTGFMPGRFVSAVWQVAVDSPVKEAENAVAEWLKESHLPFTLRRVAGGAQFDLAPAALRKGIVLAASCQSREGGGCAVAVTLTPKADLLSLLRLLPFTQEAGAACASITLLSAAGI